MKICFVSRELTGVRGGGIGTYVSEATRALAAAGHEVSLLIDAPRQTLDGIEGLHRVFSTEDGARRGRRTTFVHAEPEYGHSYRVHEALQRLGEDFDYIEFPDYGAEGFVAIHEQRLFGAYARTKLGVMLHTPLRECLSFDKQAHRIPLRERQVFSIEDDAIRHAPLLSSPSRGLAERIRSRLGLDREIAIVRYPMRLPDELPDPADAVSSLRDVKFLFFGRLEPRKGVEELVAAFRQLPEAHLTLIGSDVDCSPYGQSMRAWLQRRETPNVEFIDPLPRPELLKRLEQFHVCIFPSLFENWPNACLESMAAGRAVIGSVHGGMQEMIEHGVSGFHVDGRSSADIVRVVREELQPRLGQLPTIGSAAQERVRELTDPEIYCKTLIDTISRAPTSEHVPVVDSERHKVSIVIPFHSDRDTVDEAVDSARKQSHENLEILIVDDGSPLEDASAILDRQAAKDPRIRVLRKPNGGLSSARNHGIEHATGEFLLFLDADNRLRPGYARTGVEILTRLPGSGFVAPGAQLFDATRSDLGVNNALPFERAVSLFVNCFGDAGAFFRRSVFFDNDLRYDELLITFEDWSLWMDLERLGIRGERVPRTLFEYRIRDDSMIRTDGVEKHTDLIGLVVHRHLPASNEAERELLTTLFQEAGDAFGRPVLLRHKFVDELSKLSRKVPLLNRGLRGTLGALSRLRRGRRKEH